MVTEMDITIEKRIFRLLEHPGIKQAHLAARASRDWQVFAKTHPQSVASLTLLCPRPSDNRSLRALGSHSLVVTGHQGKDAEDLRRGLEDLPDATVLTLRD